MEQNNDRIDRLFRERLTGFEKKPGDQVWDKIAAALSKGRSRKVFLFMQIAAGMTLFIGIGVGLYQLSQRNGQTGTLVATEQPRNRKATDTVTVESNRKSLKVQPDRKKTEKSDRLQPVRRIYRGPDGPAGEEEQGIGFDSPQVYPDRYSRSGYRPDEAMLPIRQRDPGMILQQALPQKLAHEQAAVNPALVVDNYIPAEEAFPQNPEKPDRPKWMLGSEAAPLYSYRTIASENLNTGVTDAMNQSESGLFAFAGGIRVAYAAGKRLTVQSGIYYSRYGQEKNDVNAYKSNFIEVTYGQATTTYLTIRNSTGVIRVAGTEGSVYDKVVNTQSGTPADFTGDDRFNGIGTNVLTPEYTGDASVTQYFDYLELPVTLKYKIVDRKVDFSLSGGLVTNFLVGDEVILRMEGNPELRGQTSGINKVNYLGSVGLGLEFPLIRNVAASLEPRFRYYLNPVDRSSQINVHPYSLGFFAGFSYSF